MITSSDKKQLIQGELADLALYQSLRTRAKGEFAQTLDELVKTETRHAAFWKSAFKMEEIDTPGFAGSARNAFIRLNVALFGEAAGYLFLEAVESHGIKHYLQLWKKMEGDPARDGLRQILTEELEHEDMIATGGERTVDPDLIRNAFLGFNDGSVEILGAVSGLAAALGSPALIAVAAGTVSVAGAISMAAGAFLSTHAERELEDVERAKTEFLKHASDEVERRSPWRAAAIVGVGYLIGAAVPVAPFFFGATSPWWSIGLSGTLILCVSALLAFLSGMSIRRRIALNAGIVIAAVLISYGIGSWLDMISGV